MRTGITRVEVPRREARAFHKHCQEHGMRIIHECPTAKGKTIFLCEGQLPPSPAPPEQLVERKPVYEDDPTPDPGLYKDAPIVEGYLRDDGAEPASEPPASDEQDPFSDETPPVL